MNNKVVISLCVLAITSFIAIYSCNKKETTQKKDYSTWKLSPNNIYEKPLSIYNDSINNISKVNNRHTSIQSAEKIETAIICGGSPSGSYGGVGYYKYPAYTLN